MLRVLSADRHFGAIAAKSVKEVAYHARYASEWVVRLGDGTDESRARMTQGLDWMWRFVDELFDETPDLRGEWDARIDAALREAGLERPKARRGITGGREGRHSEHLGHLLSEMQFLQRAYPGASWGACSKSCAACPIRRSPCGRWSISESCATSATMPW